MSNPSEVGGSALRPRPDDPLYTVEEAAVYLRVSRSTMFNLIAKHNLEVVRFKRGQLLRQSTLDKFISDCAETHHFHSFSY